MSFYTPHLKVSIKRSFSGVLPTLPSRKIHESALEIFSGFLKRSRCGLSRELVLVLWSPFSAVLFLRGRGRYRFLVLLGAFTMSACILIATGTRRHFP